LGCQKRVPLESLLTDLRQYASSLELELIELINKDYADFVSLTTNLAGIDRNTEAVRSALSHLRKEVQAVHTTLTGTITSITTALDEMEKLRARKRTMVMLVETHKTIKKIEKLLLIDEEVVAKDEDALAQLVAEVFATRHEESSNLIQRVANDFNQLKFYVSRTRECPFVQGLERRIEFIETFIQKGLDSLFREGIRTRNPDILENCLRTYAAIGRFAGAEDVFKAMYVVPALSKIITKENLQTNPKGLCDNLPNLLAGVLTFISEECTFLLNLTRKSVKGFHFLSNSVFSALCELVASNIPEIFAVGLPDLFHKNYTVCVEFLDKFETFFASKSELAAFRSSDAHKAFMKRWNVQVYFGLRFQDIASKMEAAYSQTVNQVSESKQGLAAKDFALPCSTVLWDSLLKCWSPQFFLHSAAGHFLKLSLQLVARYLTWVDEGIAVVKEEKSDSDPCCWSSILQPTQHILLHFDLHRLSAKLKYVFLGLITKSVSLSPDQTAILEESVKAAAKDVEARERSIADILQAAIAQRCVESLKPLRGITSTYRMTKKSVPTRHSYYVPNVLSHVSTFFTQAEHHMSPALKKEWATSIIGTVTEKYLEMINELMESVSKQNKILKKIGKSKAATQTGEDGMSDMDKISVQLYLDVVEYGSCIAQCDVSADDIAPYPKLLDAVSGAKKLLQQTAGGNTGDQPAAGNTEPPTDTANA